MSTKHHTPGGLLVTQSMLPRLLPDGVDASSSLVLAARVGPPPVPCRSDRCRTQVSRTRDRQNALAPTSNIQSVMTAWQCCWCDRCCTLQVGITAGRHGHMLCLSLPGLSRGYSFGEGRQRQPRFCFLPNLSLPSCGLVTKSVAILSSVEWPAACFCHRGVAAGRLFPLSDSRLARLREGHRELLTARAASLHAVIILLLAGDSHSGENRARRAPRRAVYRARSQIWALSMDSRQRLGRRRQP